MVSNKSGRRTSGETPAWFGWALAGTILISAFLVFQVQPLICKFILPWFGGSPAVWTTCVLFFQTLLFCGYAYAHASERFLHPRARGLVHLGLIAAALATLPIAPDPGWKPHAGSDPTWHILALLAVSVGLPYLVLSSTGPLVQAWFGRSYPGRSPYRLYALSNAGSLAALISYPFFFEPAYDVARQSSLWSWAFVLFALLCGSSAVRLGRLRTHGPVGAGIATPGQGPDAARPDAPAMARRLLWLALPACASLLLLATTNHVCQDVAAIPFLWIVPLSLYLLTFIICFDHPRWYRRGVFGAAAVLSILAVAGIGPIADLLGKYDYSLGYVEELGLYFSAMFFACMVCHGELVRLRPDPRHLTDFYLMIAAGGALGGVFVSLVAPAIFSTYLEWEIGLVASYLLASTVLVLAASERVGRRPGLALAGVVLSGAGVYAILASWASEETPLDVARNFYGVVSVWEADREDPEHHRITMLHGQTVHGRQFAEASKRRLATTYYSQRSGVGRAIEYLGSRGPLRVGAVGLGVGTLASYARPGDQYRFYEINPEVRRLAGDYFTFLKDCRGACDVVMGDARLSLEREEARQFDLLALDAFSGDAIPTHLLTREAFQVYLRHLTPDGVLAVHITNNYLDLAPVVRGLADYFGLRSTSVFDAGDFDSLTYESNWMLLTRDGHLLDAIPAVLPPGAVPGPALPPWTDQHSDLLRVLIRE